MSRVVLYTVPSEEYVKNVKNVLREAAADHTVIYVTTNKPYTQLVKTLDDAGIDTENVFFIDCISKHLGEKPEAENCLLLDGPQQLTDLSIAIKESLKQLPEENRVLFFDSLSVLLMYNDAASIGKFASFIINKMRSLDVDTVMLALEEDTDNNIISKVQSFVDEVQRL